MILGLIVTGAAAGIAALAYYTHKLGAATVKADVTAELAKIEAEGNAEASTLSADAKAAYVAVAARIKALL